MTQTCSIFSARVPPQNNNEAENNAKEFHIKVAVALHCFQRNLGLKVAIILGNIFL